VTGAKSDLSGDGSGDRDGSARSAGAGVGAEVHGEGDGRGAGLARPGPPSGEVGDGAGLAGSASTSHGSDLVDEFDEDEVDVGGEFRVRPWWARTSTLVVFVVVLFVLSGAVTAWLRISDLQGQVDALSAQSFAAEEARLAAIPLAEDLASYDYRDLGGNFSRVKAAATPRFAGQLRQLTLELGPQLQQSRAVATGKVLSAGVVRATSSSVVVALFVDQTVTNTLSSTPRTEHSRMELTLVREDGVWRLDQAGEL
jgi:Mce-associated membrane protein